MKIHDICISANGKAWCALYGDGEIISNCQDISSTGFSFINSIKSCYKNGDEIVSMAVTDSCDWVYVTKEGKVVASKRTLPNMAHKVQKYLGQVYSIAITDKGYIICAEHGVYYKNIPTKVLEVIKQLAAKKVIKVIKFTDHGTVLLTDGTSIVKYYM